MSWHDDGGGLRAYGAEQQFELPVAVDSFGNSLFHLSRDFLFYQGGWPSRFMSIQWELRGLHVRRAISELGFNAPPCALHSGRSTAFQGSYVLLTCS